MKNLRTPFLFIFFLCTFVIAFNASYPKDIPEGIKNAIQTGNSRELAKYFSASVELVILNVENVYSKSQAEQILKDFFQSHKPNSFTIIHEGGKEKSIYAIGTLSTNNGTFRVYILLKETNNTYYIHQLRIENESG